MNKFKILNLILLLAFPLCYLEWGGGQSSFIGQAEYLILTQTESYRSNFTHPVILAGLFSQLCLVYGILAPKPNKWVNLIGVALLSLVVLVFFLAGALSFNYKILLSVLPFTAAAIVFFRSLKQWNAVYAAQ